MYKQTFPLKYAILRRRKMVYQSRKIENKNITVALNEVIIKV